MPKAASAQEVVPIAKVGRYRGRSGETVLHTYFDLRDENLVDKTVEIRWQDNRIRQLKIEKLWWHSNKTICRFSGCETIDDAKKLLHGEIHIKRNLLRPMEGNQYFAIDLLDIDVETVEGRLLGKVAQVMKIDENAILRVEGEKEYLIPFNEKIVIEVDLVTGKAVVDPPSGLLEINEI